LIAIFFTAIFELATLKQSENFLKIQLHKGGKEGNITFPRIKCGEIFRYFSIEKTFKKCDFLCNRTFPE